MVDSVVAGVDVGGERKGFHIVININAQYHQHFHAKTVKQAVQWLATFQPAVIAIDSPCQFASAGTSRACEIALIRQGIRCFVTPTESRAQGNPFYAWVFHGLALYQALAYPVFQGDDHDKPVCMETFPNALEKLLLQEDAEAIRTLNKKQRRLLVLEKLAYTSAALSNMDFIDAALCAISADYFYQGKFQAFGDAKDGWIVLPNFAA